MRFSGSRLAAANALLAVCYFVAGRVGLLFALVNPSASAVWPASGVAVAAVLLCGRRVWPGLFLGAFLVNFISSGRFLMSVGIAIGNTLEGVAGGYLVDRFNERRVDFERPADVVRFVLLAGALSSTIAATVGVATLYLAGIASTAGTVWLTWWLGDAVGILILAPLILLWARDSSIRWTREQTVQAIFILAGIVLVGQALFGGLLPRRLEHYPLDFLCIPLLMWVAFRFGPREAATAVLVLAGIALQGTQSGFGPFFGASENDSLLLVEGFLGFAALLALVFAAVVSESRRGLEAIAREATIVKFSNDAIVSKTLTGMITSWNFGAERMFGFSSEEAVGQHITIIIPPERQHEEDEVLKKIGRGEVMDHFETIRMRKDGTRIHVSLTISPVKAPDGTVIGASKIGRDISDRVRLEAERDALLAREKAARASAEAGNRAKDEFLAILSHELRTPLNAVYGWARMMQTGELDAPTSARALDAIVRNSNVQVQLIDDLLDISRIVNDKMRLEVRPTDIREVIEAAVDAVRPAADAKGLHLEVVLDPRGGTVDGDPARLQQIVWNLLSNAVKFTPAGGDVELRLERCPGTIEIVVRDTGQGISASVLPFVFDRFRQWDSSSTRTHSGLGLGLALVKHLTELHRGTVSAVSAGEGAGATFKVTLPLAVRAQRLQPLRPDAAPLAPGTQGRLIGLRVLVVDDDLDALDLASAILGGEGATVKTCRTAADALAMLQAWRPDVLVSDIDMPGEDGYSLIRRVRALSEDRVARTPALALTAYGRAEDRAQTLSAGYSMHIPKPVDPDEFTTIIASVARVLSPQRND